MPILLSIRLSRASIDSKRILHTTCVSPLMGTDRKECYRLTHPLSKISGYATHTSGDGDVMSMPAGFRRHLVGKTPINVFHCDIAEMRFVGMVLTIQTFS